MLQPFFMKIFEIQAQRALSKSPINLAHAVINPYKGCEYACEFCYAAKDKDGLKWGQYVCVKINLPDVLKQELKTADVKSVLIGSSTECYQSVEKKYEITRKLLEILRDHKKSVIILTRATLVTRDIDILKNMNHRIFVTYKEHNSQDLKERFEAINKMVDAGLNVEPYVCPIDFKDDVQKYFDLFNKVKIKGLHFENLNPLKKFELSESMYNDCVLEMKNNINELGKKYSRQVFLHFHEYDAACRIDYNL